MPFIPSIAIEQFQTALGKQPSSVNTILQCFVDQNLELNENISFGYNKLDASFQFSSLNVNEGSIVPIRVSLNSPSTLGIEELDVYFLNNTTSGVNVPGDVNLSFPIEQPLRLAWTAGEQHKFITLSAFTDFLLEGTESFKLKLDHFVNCEKGSRSQLNVNIQDTTNLRSVGIESTNGSMLVTSSPGPINLVYNIPEGSARDIVISLDSPSIFGIEEVDVVFSSPSPTLGGASSTDYSLSIPQPIRLTWSIGEQTKIIKLSAFTDIDFFEADNEAINIQLLNPASVVIETPPLTLPTGIAKFSFASAYIENNAPQYEYSRIYLGPFATQPGRIASYPSYNLLQPYTSYSTVFGGYTSSENHRFFLYDPVGGATYSPAFSIQNLNNFDKTKLRIDIKNSGNYPIKYQNIILNTGQTMSLTADTLNYFLDLPANFSQILDSSGNTITVGASYDFSMYMSYTGNNPTLYYYGEFRLKDLSNNLSTNKTLDLGYQLFDTYPQSTFSTTTNSYYLITKFSNIGTGRSGISCPTFGFTLGTQENVALDGMYFVDTYSQTDYIGIEFRQGGGINATCLTSYNIPYEVIP